MESSTSSGSGIIATLEALKPVSSFKMTRHISPGERERAVQFEKDRNEAVDKFDQGAE